MKDVLKSASLVPLLVACLLASCTPASGSAESVSSDSELGAVSNTPALSPERIAFLEDDVRDGYSKRAPWQDVSWTRSNQTEVLLDGVWYDFESIDGVTEAELLEFAQLVYGDHWRKRVAEDLVAVLTHMERAPGTTVALGLVDQDTGRSVMFENASMTEGNRRSVWEAGNARGEW